MKGKISIMKGKGEIIVGSKVLYLDKIILTVDSIKNNIINSYIPKDKVILLKYYVTNKHGIIGEVEASDASLLNDGDVVNYKCRKVPNQMNVGDKVVITSLNGKLFKELANSFSNSIKGVITSVKGIHCKIKVNGYDKLVETKRPYIKLVNANEKTLCKIV